MKPRTISMAGPVLIVAFAGIAWWVEAGSLDPPTGGITPTMKDLDTVEPRIPVSAATTPGDADSVFRIASPGSYYLTGNVTGAANKRGIEIATGSVTLDLMGFQVVGVASSLEGIGYVASPGAGTVTIRNGHVRDWEFHGILTNNADGAIIEDVIAFSNNGDGINCFKSCVITNCAATDNGGNGVSVGADSTISHCIAEGNAVHGLSNVAGESMVTFCTANNNSSNGISVASGSTISQSTASNNGGNGIDTGLNCAINDCTVSLSAADGIQTSNNCTVINCTVTGSGLDGIQVGADSRVLNNTVDDNGNSAGSAGIHATSSGCRIEGNTLTDNNTTGIDVDGSGNLIIRNWFNGNTANVIQTGTNLVGPTVTSANIATEDSASANYEF